MSFTSLALRCLFVVAGVSSLVGVGVAQSIVVTEHRGQPYPVIGARGMRPYIEVDGKRILAEGAKFGLRTVPEFLPAFVSVRGLKVHSSSLVMSDGGNRINNEFHFDARFETPYALDDVFLVLELTLADGGASFFLYEVGDLRPNRQHPVSVVARSGYPLGSGHFKFHLYSGGLEILHSEQPFAMREQMLDGLIARRIKDRPDGPLAVFFGPMPDYPAKLEKSKIPGEVQLRVRIRPTGAVVDATIVSATEPSMGEAALTAVRQWRFLPRIKNGRPVETIAVIPIAFTPTLEAEKD